MSIRAPLCLFLAGVGFACTETTPGPPDLFIQRGDLAEIQGRGSLRVLVPTLREENLTGTSWPAHEDREMAAAFARRLGVEPRFIAVPQRNELLELLEWGYGDLVTAQLTITPEREERFAFSRPTATVSEWLVGRRGDSNLPRKVTDLNGREIHVRKSSSFAGTLARLASETGVRFEMVEAPEEMDTESLVKEVSEGRRPLTIVDGNLLSSIESHNENIERLFVLAEGRQLGWALRKDATELAAAADAFIIEHFLTGHREEDRSTGGLESIRRRGSLRVLTLNNSVNYFLYRGQRMGFDYDIAQLAAARLGVRLEMVVPPRRDLIFDWLQEGRGDLIASTLTVTPQRQETLSFSRPYLFTEELVVRAVDAPDKISSVSELRGGRIHAWRSSSHYQTLSRLREELGEFEIVAVPEDLEVDEILDRVATGEYPLGVVDSHMLEAELRYRDDVEPAFPLVVRPGDEDEPSVWARDKAVAFAVRPSNRELRAFLDEFVEEIYKSLDYNLAVDRYFRNNRSLLRVREQRSAISGRLSPYDDLIKRFSKQYGLDWRLMAAQAYQESRFDPGAESWSGAQGLFQLMPATAQELGFSELHDPETGIHAGIRYMHLLIERLDPRIPFKHRVRFALAAYNAGWGHMQDARLLAEEEGWDPNKWFGHTEKAMLLLQKPQHYQNAEHGYVRGSEPVAYVSKIQNLYDHYVSIVSP